MFRRGFRLLSSSKGKIGENHPQGPTGLPMWKDRIDCPHIVRDGERWWVLDVAGEQLSRVGEVAAYIVSGRLRCDFTPGLVNGDNLILINCKDVVMVGDQWVRTPITWTTHWPAGKYRVRCSEMYDRDPCLLVWYYADQALRKEFGSRNVREPMIESLYLYEDAVHPHANMCPRPFRWTDWRTGNVKYRDPAFQQRWTPNPVMV